LLNLILDNNDVDKLSTSSIKIKEVNYYLLFAIFKEALKKQKNCPKRAVSFILF